MKSKKNLGTLNGNFVKEGTFLSIAFLSFMWTRMEKWFPARRYSSIKSSLSRRNLP